MVDQPVAGSDGHGLVRENPVPVAERVVGDEVDPAECRQRRLKTGIARGHELAGAMRLPGLSVLPDVMADAAFMPQARHFMALRIGEF